MIIKQIKYFGGLELEQWLPIQFEVISTPGWIESQGRRPILLIQTRNIKLSKVLSAYYQWIKNEKIIWQIARISEVCNQIGDRVL